MISYSTETLRKTILGKIVWRRCPMCEGSGVQNWNEDGEDIKPGWGSYENDRCTGECDNCDGLGFVKGQEEE